MKKKLSRPTKAFIIRIIFLLPLCMAGYLLAQESGLELAPSAATAETTAESAATTEATAVSADDQQLNMTSVNQEQLDFIAKNLQVSYQIIEKNSELCSSAQGGSCSVSELRLTSTQALVVGNWSIYFSHISPLTKIIAGDFILSYINGDLHRVSPTANINSIDALNPQTIRFTSNTSYVARSHLMPNYYIVAEGLEARVIDSTRTGIDPQTALSTQPYIGEFNNADKYAKSNKNDKIQIANAQSIFKDNTNMLQTATPSKKTKVQKKSNTFNYAIVPTPSFVKPLLGKNLDLKTGLSLSLEGIEYSSVQAAMRALQNNGIKKSSRGVPLSINVKTKRSSTEGSYTLTIANNRISIAAASHEGAANALRTLASLVMPGSTSVPQIRIEDSPRYTFRGLHIDVARNFHGKKQLKKIMEQMAVFKLNKLHLHLGEDEAWRLQIKDLPELTELGSKRCHDPEENTCLLAQLGSGSEADSTVNGYYSIADYIDIVRYANARHIQVIPSFDMPGHSRAAIKSMELRYRKYMALGDQAKAEQYLLSDANDTTRYYSVQSYTDNTINPCMDSSYDFLEKVIDEVITLHKKAGQPLTRYHIGADETAGAWLESPRCHAFFNNPANKITSADQLGGYFIERVSAILSRKAIQPAGWNDGMEHVNPANMPAVVQSNVWGPLFWKGHKSAHQQVNRNWDVIVSTPDVTYFDAPYETNVFEPGYTWSSRSTNTRKVFNFMPDNLPAHAETLKSPSGKDMEMDDRIQKDASGNITHRPMQKGLGFKGIQGHLWSETVRTNQRVDYMLFPRLIALAERAWHTGKWELPYDHSGKLYSAKTYYFTNALQEQRDQEWSEFAQVLAHKVFPKLDRAAIGYRVPMPGAMVITGKLHVNNIFPGLPLEYQINDGRWKRWLEPVKVRTKDKINVRSLSADGKRIGRAWIVQ